MGRLLRQVGPETGRMEGVAEGEEAKDGKVEVAGGGRWCAAGAEGKKVVVVGADEEGDGSEEDDC